MAFIGRESHGQLANGHNNFVTELRIEYALDSGDLVAQYLLKMSVS